MCAYDRDAMTVQGVSTVYLMTVQGVSFMCAYARDALRERAVHLSPPFFLVPFEDPLTPSLFLPPFPLSSPCLSPPLFFLSPLPTRSQPKPQTPNLNPKSDFINDKLYNAHPMCI